MSWLSDWWNGVELWITQLAFPFQFAIVIAVLLPVCAGLAWLIDRVVDFGASKVSPSRGEEVDCD
ncbi:hypothetical protein LWC34_53620 [Kibdelosporangium philippinense]|uniref:Uncharacterized protein n=1 Tax=Kibdelosporangium philippinense TaxID=211113 RepID=A0ABS8ZY85_9PSEU|nr:hypothetical protein [Kibdelosporangium philippinense]MCE7011598.1 hypothetical protein [Kibdelosporangium philippinense]